MNVLCQIDEMIKSRGKTMEVKEMYSVVGETSTTNFIVKVENETWIGVCELGGALEEDRLIEAAGK